MNFARKMRRAILKSNGQLPSQLRTKEVERAESKKEVDPSQPVPYGFRVEMVDSLENGETTTEAQYMPEQRELEVASLIFALADSGRGAKATLGRLQEHGIKYRDEEWTLERIHDVLRRRKRR